ncbi:MAG: hypothetical protein JRD89_03520 [Deltaproteobacteria bacterium]|nr:hypothetical protein [Deltaproteobacteria bacterium]
MSERRTAVIYIAAVTGHVRAARGLVGRAIRRSLGVKQWYTDPYFVTYRSRADVIRDGADAALASPRFTLEITDDERELLEAELIHLAADEGWLSGPPVDIYHD